MTLTIILIAVTVIVSIVAWNSPERLSQWMMNPYRVKNNREYYRFISSGLIHHDYIHLLFNMITLYYFGTVVEQIFRVFYGDRGYLYFLVLYFAGMIIADIPSYFKYRNSPAYNSLGASGAVSAVLFSSILFNPVNKISIIFIPIGIPGFIFGFLFLLYSYYEGKRMAGNVNHDAHIYGALFGIFFTIILYPSVIVSFFQKIINYKFF